MSTKNTLARRIVAMLYWEYKAAYRIAFTTDFKSERAADSSWWDMQTKLFMFRKANRILKIEEQK